MRAPSLRSSDEVQRCANTQESNAPSSLERAGGEQFLARGSQRDEANPSTRPLDDRDGFIGSFTVDFEPGRWGIGAGNLEFRNCGCKFASCSAERLQRGPEKIDREASRCSRAAKGIYEVGPRGSFEGDTFKSGERYDGEAVGKNKFGLGVCLAENSRCPVA